MGLDGTPLHEHEETQVSRVRMQAGIEKARSADDSVKGKRKEKSRGAGIEKARSADDSEKKKEKKKAEAQESKKRRALTIP